MNKIPQSAPRVSDNIIGIYLEKAMPTQLLGYTEINKKLQEANV